MPVTLACVENHVMSVDEAIAALVRAEDKKNAAEVARDSAEELVGEAYRALQVADQEFRAAVRERMIAYRNKQAE